MKGVVAVMRQVPRRPSWTHSEDAFLCGVGARIRGVIRSRTTGDWSERQHEGARAGHPQALAGKEAARHPHNQARPHIPLVVPLLPRNIFDMHSIFDNGEP